MENAMNKAAGEPLAHQGYEGETSVAREVRLKRERERNDPFVEAMEKANYQQRNTIQGIDPYAPIAEAALRPTQTRCGVLGCCNHAGSGVMRSVIVCVPCAQMLNTGEPDRGSTFIHLLKETLNVTQLVARRDHATELLRVAAKRRGVELSPGAYDIAMDALVAALKEGAGPYRESLYGQAESEKSNAGVQSR